MPFDYPKDTQQAISATRDIVAILLQGDISQQKPLFAKRSLHVLCHLAYLGLGDPDNGTFAAQELDPELAAVLKEAATVLGYQEDAELAGAGGVLVNLLITFVARRLFQLLEELLNDNGAD